MGVDAQMFIKTTTKLTPLEVTKLAYQMGRCFGHKEFMRTSAHEVAEDRARGYDHSKVRHNLTAISKYEQDGPDIKPKPGQYFYEVNLWGRYYGPGYERGDLPFYVMLASWLEMSIPGAEVWYGGDSSGMCAERFGPEERQIFLKHWAETGHAWVDMFSGSHSPRHPVCEFCANAPMFQSTFAQGRPLDDRYECHGCGVVKNGAHEIVKEKAL